MDIKYQHWCQIQPTFYNLSWVCLSIIIPYRSVGCWTWSDKSWARENPLRVGGGGTLCPANLNQAHSDDQDEECQPLERPDATLQHRRRHERRHQDLQLVQHLSPDGHSPQVRTTSRHRLQVPHSAVPGRRSGTGGVPHHAAVVRIQWHKLNNLPTDEQKTNIGSEL